jgi:hypothetical protein
MPTLPLLDPLHRRLSEGRFLHSPPFLRSHRRNHGMRSSAKKPGSKRGSGGRRPSPTTVVDRLSAAASPGVPRPWSCLGQQWLPWRRRSRWLGHSFRRVAVAACKESSWPCKLEREAVIATTASGFGGTLTVVNNRMMTDPSHLQSRLPAQEPQPTGPAQVPNVTDGRMLSSIAHSPWPFSGHSPRRTPMINNDRQMPAYARRARNA